MEVEQQGIQEVHQHSGMVAEATVVVQATYDPTTMQVVVPPPPMDGHVLNHTLVEALHAAIPMHQDGSQVQGHVASYQVHHHVEGSQTGQMLDALSHQHQHQQHVQHQFAVEQVHDQRMSLGEHDHQHQGEQKVDKRYGKRTAEARASVSAGMKIKAARRKVPDTGQDSGARISLGDRLAVAQRLENKEISPKDAQAALGCCKSYVSQMMKPHNLARLKQKVALGLDPKLTKAHLPKFPQMEEKLNYWIHEVAKQHPNISPPVSMPVMQSKALEFSEAMGVPDFKASNSWFINFIKRYGLDRLGFQVDESPMKRVGMQQPPAPHDMVSIQGFGVVQVMGQHMQQDVHYQHQPQPPMHVEVVQAHQTHQMHVQHPDMQDGQMEHAQAVEVHHQQHEHVQAVEVCHQQHAQHDHSQQMHEQHVHAEVEGHHGHVEHHVQVEVVLPEHHQEGQHEGQEQQGEIMEVQQEHEMQQEQQSGVIQTEDEEVHGQQDHHHMQQEEQQHDGQHQHQHQEGQHEHVQQHEDQEQQHHHVHEEQQHEQEEQSNFMANPAPENGENGYEPQQQEQQEQDQGQDPETYEEPEQEELPLREGGEGEGGGAAEGEAEAEAEAEGETVGGGEPGVVGVEAEPGVVGVETEPGVVGAEGDDLQPGSAEHSAPPPQ